jgi:hypothetical protein
MMIQARTIVGAAAAFALVGAALWGSTALSPPAKAQAGHVEISAVDNKAWSVEVTPLSDDSSVTRTAANR